MNAVRSLAPSGILLLFGVILLTLPDLVLATAGEVRSQVMISRDLGTLTDGDLFGSSISRIGDLNGDGIEDIVVGAMGDEGGGQDRGAVWVLLLDAAGHVQGFQKINDVEGGFTGVLNDVDQFGSGVAGLGDLDGDGNEDIAVGSVLDDDGDAPNQGAVWILFLNSDGTVRSHQKISEVAGGFTGSLDEDDRFGRHLGVPGDIDGDGVSDLAVSAQLDDDGGVDQGAVWILFMKKDGTVKGHQKISELQGGLGSVLDPSDNFGFPCGIGDLDGDCVPDIAVGAPAADEGGANRGAVWVLFLNPQGTVKAKQMISDLQGGFPGTLDDGDVFGGAIAWLGHVTDASPGALAVSAIGDDDGGVNRGAIWVLHLNPNGTVGAIAKLSSTSGGFQGPLGNEDRFGSAIAGLGDLDGDGRSDMAAGAYFSNDGGPDRGAAWALFLEGDPVPALPTTPWSGPVEIYATFPARPGEVEVAANGDVYVGNFYYPGQDGDFVSINRIPAGSQAACPCGPRISDPDVIAIDELGSITTAGDIVVGTHVGLFALKPDCSQATPIVEWAMGVNNPQDMDFDGLGRLLFPDFTDRNVLAYSGGTITQVIPAFSSPPSIAVDSLDIYLSVGSSPVRKYDVYGTLLDSTFTTGAVHKVVTINGRKGLLVTRSDRLVFVTLPDREEWTLLENVTSTTGIDVDSSGSLFVSQLNARRLLKVSLLDPAGVIDDGETSSLPLRLSAVPNPFATSARFVLEGTTAGPTTIQIYDTAGRLVREMTGEVWGSGSASVAWDGRDQMGRVTSAGLYYVEARSPGGRVTAPVKLVRLSR